MREIKIEVSWRFSDRREKGMGTLAGALFVSTKEENKAHPLWRYGKIVRAIFNYLLLSSIYLQKSTVVHDFMTSWNTSIRTLSKRLLKAKFEICKNKTCGTAVLSQLDRKMWIRHDSKCQRLFLCMYAQKASSYLFFVIKIPLQPYLVKVLQVAILSRPNFLNIFNFIIEK